MVDRVHHQGGSGKVSVQGMREWKTAATTVLGDTKELSQGRVMIYCKVTAAVTSVGTIYGTKAQEANHSNVVCATAAAVGAKEVIICCGATATPADEYADGFLLVNDAAGEGYTYMIERHASAASGSGFTVYLKDGIEVALTTASQVTLCVNRGCVIPASTISAGTVLTSAPTGVCLCTQTVAQTTYMWMGMRGPWATIAGNPTPINPGIEVAVGSAGVIAVVGTATSSMVTVGKCITTAAATENILVNFTL
jgi:hypothetical protein